MNQVMLGPDVKFGMPGTPAPSLEDIGRLITERADVFVPPTGTAEDPVRTAALWRTGFFELDQSVRLAKVEPRQALAHRAVSLIQLSELGLVDPPTRSLSDI